MLHIWSIKEKLQKKSFFKLTFLLSHFILIWFQFFESILFYRLHWGSRLRPSGRQWPILEDQGDQRDKLRLRIWLISPRLIGDRNQNKFGIKSELLLHFPLVQVITECAMVLSLLGNQFQVPPALNIPAKLHLPHEQAISRPGPTSHVCNNILITSYWPFGERPTPTSHHN